MIKYSRRTREGWYQVDEMVRRWMQQRIQLTEDFEQVITPHAAEESASELTSRIRAFCQTLVDYVSAGHFEIYNELITEAREFGDGSLGRGIDLCQAITLSTDLALEFNDRYDTDEHCRQQFHSLPRDLLELGNILNMRFELEDSLITSVHDCHRTLVA